MYPSRPSIGSCLSPCAGYTYLHVYLQKLWHAVGVLPISFANCMSIDERVQLWVLSSVGYYRIAQVGRPRPRFASLEEAFSKLMTWYLVP
jgi:hypothetical protein